MFVVFVAVAGTGIAKQQRALEDAIKSGAPAEVIEALAQERDTQRAKVAKAKGEAGQWSGGDECLRRRVQRH